METQDYIRGGRQKASYALSETVHWDCPLCGQSSFKNIKTERGALGVVSCLHCSLIRIEPRLASPEAIYHGDPKIYSEEFRLVRSGKFPHHRDTNYQRDLALIRKYKPKGNFLDIGTNTGSFLRLAQGQGWKTTGIEPAPELAKLAREWWGLEIVESFIEDANLPSRHFDIVTMTDVFEHIVNPKQVLGAVRKVIKSDGLLFIKVPNGKFNLFKFYMRKFLGRPGANDFDAYEHVLHYTEKTLKEMLLASGFQPFRFTIEPPVQIPVWHEYVGHYYQHESPFWLDPKLYAGRRLLYWAAFLERAITRRIGWLSPNIGCLAYPLPN